jgi:hypothetical protein
MMEGGDGDDKGPPKTTRVTLQSTTRLSIKCISREREREQEWLEDERRQQTEKLSSWKQPGRTSTLTYSISIKRNNQTQLMRLSCSTR